MPINPPSYFYGKTGRSVIYCSMGNWLKVGRTPVEADLATFEPLGPNVAIDKDRVYYKYHPQPHIDRQTFEVDGLVWRDQETVYYPKSHEPLLASIDGVDPKSFEVLFPDDVNPRKWARDAHRYYLYFEPVDVDAQTFRFLNNAFVADKNLI